MYITLAEVRANSEKTYQYFAGAGGSPISEQQFLSVRVPDDVLENSSKSDFLKRLFGLLDADSDGQVTFSEWQNQIDRDLQFADENGDGRITLKELSNARENMSFGDALGMVF
jgi:Ca2+-binding EF-hand superfamily protein